MTQYINWKNYKCLCIYAQKYTSQCHAKMIHQGLYFVTISFHMAFLQLSYARMSTFYDLGWYIIMKTTHPISTTKHTQSAKSVESNHSGMPKCKIGQCWDLITSTVSKQVTRFTEHRPYYLGFGAGCGAAVTNRGWRTSWPQLPMVQLITKADLKGTSCLQQQGKSVHHHYRYVTLFLFLKFTIFKMKPQL